MTSIENAGALLEAIRRAEAEVKRRLAAEREAADAVLAEAQQRAHELLRAAKVEGHCAGEEQRRTAQAEFERDAKEILAQAHGEADRLRHAAEQHMTAAVARAVEIVIGGVHET